jgi:2-oxoglutarate dehydrogenase E2 component (dihydrolipoamide succinyltransferase)
MAKYKLLLPKMGESVAEATVIRWTKNPGDHIDTDETVMEIATDKVDSDVPSPVSGKLLEKLYKDNDVVQVGAVIAIIETADAEETVKPELAPAPPVQQPMYREPAAAATAYTPPPVVETPRPQPAPIPQPAPVQQPAPEIKQTIFTEQRPTYTEQVP